MSEHLLDDLHVGSRGDGQRGRSVPELVRVKAGFADRGCSGREGSVVKDGCAQRPSGPGSGEDEIAGHLAGDVGLQVVDEEGRNRYLSPLVSLRGAEDLLGPDEGHGLGDDGASSPEIEPADSQRCHLAEAHSGVGEKQHDQSVVLATALAEPPVLAEDLLPEAGAGLGEALDFEVVEVLPFGLDDARQIDAGGGIARQPAVLDRHQEHE